jgi:hypothetical protein
VKKAVHGYRPFEPTCEGSRVGKVLRSLLACTVAIAISISANASGTWVYGTVTQVGSYSTGAGPAQTLFMLSPQPTGITCSSGTTFAITVNNNTSQEIRNNMLAILLSAKATGSTVQVLYDPTVCDSGYVSAFAIWIE